MGWPYWVKGKVPRFRAWLVLALSAEFKEAPGKGGALVGKAFFPRGGTVALLKTSSPSGSTKSGSSKLPAFESPLPGPAALTKVLLLEIQLLSTKPDHGPHFPTFDIWPALLILPGQSCHKRLFPLWVRLTLVVLWVHITPHRTWSPARCPLESWWNWMSQNVTEALLCTLC